MKFNKTNFEVKIQIIVTVIVHIRTYGGVSRAGYVPSCTYPPQLSLNTYQVVNNAIFWIIMANCVLTIAVLLLNIYKDKRLIIFYFEKLFENNQFRIKKSVFDTKTRYNSFENVLTTKAICSVTSTQFVFLSFSTAARKLKPHVLEIKQIILNMWFQLQLFVLWKPECQKKYFILIFNISMWVFKIVSRIIKFSGRSIWKSINSCSDLFKNQPMYFTTEEVNW